MDTTEKLVHYPGTIWICADEDDSQGIRWRIYCPGNAEPLILNEIGRVLIEIDRILDELHYPESSTVGRYFKKPAWSGRNAKEWVAMQKQEGIRQKGGKGTFVVQIQYRQHATWQGNVLWAEKDKTIQFRSALELLKLIDNALDESAAMTEEKPAWTKDTKMDSYMEK